MSKKLLALLGGLAVMITAATVWIRGAASETSPSPGRVPSRVVARPVPTAEVQAAPDSQIRLFPGRVRASRRVELGFSVPGLLKHLRADEGRHVRQGEVLAKLDQRDFEHARDAAKAKFIRAEQELARYRNLREKKVAARTECESAQKAYDVSLADLRIREKALEDTTLLAPFNGVIAKRYVENHEHIQAKRPILSLQDIGFLEVVIQVPEQLIAKHGTEGFRALQVRFDADGDRWFDASPREASAQSDPITQTYDLVVGLRPPDGLQVFPGMTAMVRARIPQPREGAEGAQQVTLVPVEALWSGTDGKSYVWLIHPAGKTPVKREVSMGALRQNKVEILSGLAPGQRVAVAGLHALREGHPVRPMAAGGEGLDG